MKQFEICIVESRDLVFEVEAANAEEAATIAYDMGGDEAVRDSFRERIIEWAEVKR